MTSRARFLNPETWAGFSPFAPSTPDVSMSFRVSLKNRLASTAERSYEDPEIPLPTNAYPSAQSKAERTVLTLHKKCKVRRLKAVPRNEKFPTSILSTSSTKALADRRFQSHSPPPHVPVPTSSWTLDPLCAFPRP